MHLLIVHHARMACDGAEEYTLTGVRGEASGDLRRTRTIWGKGNLGTLLPDHPPKPMESALICP